MGVYDLYFLFHREFPNRPALIQIVIVTAATLPSVKMAANVVTCVMPTREDTTAHVRWDSGDTGVNSKSDHAETSCWATKQKLTDCTVFLTKMTSYSRPIAILIRSLISHGL